MLQRALRCIWLMMGFVGFAASAAGGDVVNIGQVAPDLAGGPWINSQPLTMAELCGRVVFVEFWTYG
jgi:hypothetical protein